MDYPQISVKKDHELFFTPMKSGGTKRPSSHEDDGTDAKRNRCDGDVQEAVVKSKYHPIASLTPELVSPLVRGRLASISPWCTYADRKVTCMNFRLEDESGGIPGIVYAPMSNDFIKDFRPKAEVIIEHVRVQRLRQGFRTSKDQFQIIVNKWTKIRIIPEPVETSASAIDALEAFKPVDPASPKPCSTSPSPGVQQSSFSSSGFPISVHIHTPPLTAFAPINVASGSWSGYPVATAPAALPSLSSTASIAPSRGTISNRFAAVSEVFSNGAFPDYGRLSSINEIQSTIRVGTTIDMIGLAVRVGTSRSKLTRKGHTATVREITLTDETCSEITLTIWGPDNSIIPPNSVLLVKKATVILCNETKQLTCIRGSVIVDPDIPEAHRLENLAVSVPIVAETVLPRVAELNTSLEVSENKVPLVHSNLCSINEVQSKIAVGTTMDVIGLVVQVGDPKTRMTRRGHTASVREVTLRDDICSEINLAIWESEGGHSYIQVNSVLVAKNAKVILYNDKKQLTCLRAYVIVDPDIPEAHRLKNFLSSVPVVTEKARPPVPLAGRNSGISPIEVPFITGPLSSISKIHSEIAVGTKVDLIGFAVRVEEPISRITRKGNAAFLREVTLKDDSDAQINLAIWEPGQDSSQIPPNSVFLVKNATVIVYNQVKKLTCQRVCVTIDPDISQAHRLKKHIEDMKLQTQKTETVVPPYGADNSTQMRMEIGETSKESKIADIMLYEVSADIPEAHRNFPKRVSAVTETARSPVTVLAGRSSDISSYEVPQAVLNLCPIKRIHSEIALGTKVDLIGLAVRVEELKSRTTRKGYDAFLREVTLKEDSCSEIDVAIWEAGQDSSPIIPNSVLLVKNATVIVYNQVKKLTCQRVCVSVDPDISEAHRLKKQIEDVKPQTPKTETLVLPDATDSSAHIKMRIDETPEESKTDKMTNGISADIPEAHRLKNLPISVSVVTEKARHPVAVNAGRSSDISSYEAAQVDLNLCPINRILSEIALETKVDLIGIAARVEEPKSRKTRKGYNAFLTDVTLKDDSGSQINLAIWEAGRESSPILLKSVLLVKNATVLVYNDVKKLSCQRVSVSIDPDIPQTHILKKQSDDATLQETQEMNPAVPPDATDVSKPISTTIGERPEASKTESTHTPLDKISDELKTESVGKSVDVLGVVLHEDPVQHLVRADEDIPEAHGLKNRPSSVPVVTEKPHPVVAAVAGTSYDISNEVPLVTDNLYTIKRIHSDIAVGTKVDLIGLAVQVDEPKSRMTRKGYDAFVREVTLKDDSCSEIDVAIWEARDDCSRIPLNSVLLVKNAAVISYKEQKKLTCQRVSVSVDPDIPRARELKKKIEHAPCETQTDSSTVKERTIESSNGQAKNRYTGIDKIQDDLSAGMNVNILGVVTHRDPIEHLVKNDTDNYKVTLVIVDQSRRKIMMTVWGPRALTLSDEQYWIVEGLNIRVHEYNGEKQLTCTERLSTLNAEPNIAEAEELRQWLSAIWLKTEESYAATAADYKSNSEKNVENTLILRQVLPVPTHPELVTYTPIDLVHQRIPKGSTINIVGIVDWTQSMRLIKKLDHTVCMREINVLDDSRKSIWVTIWGDKAKIDTTCHSVVAIINATVRANNDVKDLVCSDKESLFFVDPRMARTRELLDWYKINAVDNIFVETIMPITPNNLVFSTFRSGEMTSVIGVIVKIYESQYVEGQSARLDVCRRIEMIDDSEETINLFMWGEPARDFNLLEETILLVTNIRVFVKDQYKACVSSAWSHFVVDPIAPDNRDKVKRIRLWWCGYKMRQPQCRANTPTAQADDSKHLTAIMKKEPIAEVANCNESAGAAQMDNSNVNESVVDPMDNSNVDESAAHPTLQLDMDENQLQEYLGDERQRWDFY